MINRNCVKLSYSCTKNMKALIQSHNSKVLSNRGNPKEKTSCNCRDRTKCELDNKCQSGPIVYQATIGEGTEERKYIGSTQNFKERHNRHKTSFKNQNHKNETTLAKHIWDEGLAPDPKIKWEILRHAPTYNKGGKYCDLCLTEKLLISKVLGNPTYLNRRSDLATKCRHRAKFKLCNIK